MCLNKLVLKFDDKVTNIDDVKRLDKLGKLKRHLHSPTFKDTWQVPANGYTIVRYIFSLIFQPLYFKKILFILRFFSDNPGVWFHHCTKFIY